MRFAIKKDSDKFLVLLILTDFVFISLHIFHTYTGLLPNPLFSIEGERVYAEIYQYIKELWIVVLLISLAMRRANSLYLSWALLFFYVLLDDSLAVHERLGSLIVSWFDFHPGFGLRAQDFGELMVFFFFGAILFVLIAITYYLSGFADRRISKYLFSMVALLVFFGVVLDMVHQIVKHSLVKPVLGMIEDGGEMLVMSVITWFVFSSNSSCREVSVASQKVE
jgi:hypothetical protein